jgi:hypothetical protein
MMYIVSTIPGEGSPGILITQEAEEETKNTDRVCIFLLNFYMCSVRTRLQIYLTALLVRDSFACSKNRIC